MYFILGMANYLQTFGSRLSQQNKRSLGYLKRDLSSFYGVDDFVGHLRKLGNHAIQRSTVDGSSRHKKIMSIAGVGRVSRLCKILVLSCHCHLKFNHNTIFTNITFELPSLGLLHLIP